MNMMGSYLKEGVYIRGAFIHFFPFLSGHSFRGVGSVNDEGWRCLVKTSW